MTDRPQVLKKASIADWFVRGSLSRIGDIIDRFTGRKWTPASSLATSGLIERLKKLLDAEAKEIDGKGVVVPHNIKLKIQWDKFSTDSEGRLSALRDELLTAAADHINDSLYYTLAPLQLEVKTDYFVEGVKLYVSFDKFVDDDAESGLNVTLPAIHLKDMPAIVTPEETPAEMVFSFSYEVGGKPLQKTLRFGAKDRRSVGRGAANDLVLDDPSVSKIHASLATRETGELVVADTGSTNGTFVNDRRISYGLATKVESGDRIKFGQVKVKFEPVEMAADQLGAFGSPTTIIGDIEFTSRSTQPLPVAGNEPENISDTVEVSFSGTDLETERDDPRTDGLSAVNEESSDREANGDHQE